MVDHWIPLTSYKNNITGNQKNSPYTDVPKYSVAVVIDCTYNGYCPV